QECLHFIPSQSEMAASPCNSSITGFEQIDILSGDESLNSGRVEDWYQTEPTCIDAEKKKESKRVEIDSIVARIAAALSPDHHELAERKAAMQALFLLQERMNEAGNGDKITTIDAKVYKLTGLDKYKRELLVIDEAGADWFEKKGLPLPSIDDIQIDQGKFGLDESFTQFMDEDPIDQPTHAGNVYRETLLPAWNNLVDRASGLVNRLFGSENSDIEKK
ncbi:hypothetical protein PFISCL1PPCAC_12569, partial [Pristionchus fissidentatus]